MKTRSSASIATLIVLTTILLAGIGHAEQVLYQFKGHGSDAKSPRYLVERNGRLYGVSGGGNFGQGTVFELKPPDIKGAPWTERVLHNFHVSSSDGAVPASRLVFDNQGNIYGALECGGASGGGAIFQLSPPVPPSTKWTETLVYSFSQTGPIGFDPSSLTVGLHGQLYGATSAGGSYSGGAVFELSKSKNGVWTESALYSFGTNPGDGTDALYGLIADQAGNLYGVTTFGGASNGKGYGTVYQLHVPVAPGAPWTESILYTFGLGSAVSPSGGLILDNAGNLYGPGCCGTGGLIYEVSPNGDGTWTESTVYAFLGGSDGLQPVGDLLLDDVGNLYGATPRGGYVTRGCDLGCGTIFRLSPPSVVGGGWTETQLYQFASRPGGPDDGAFPYGNLIFGPSGDLYGGTQSGDGASKAGIVFSVHP